MDNSDNNNKNNWPAAYYELQSIEDRRKMLNQRLAEPDYPKEELERRRLFHMRYKSWEGRSIDTFMDAWMTIRLYQNPSFLFRNEKKFPKEMKEQAEKLGLIHYPKDEYLRAEWKHFTRLYIKTCLTGSTYKSKILVFFPLSPEKLALKIAEDIDLGTSVVPRIADLEEAFKPLREIFLESYREMVDQGDKYWKEYLDSKK